MSDIVERLWSRMRDWWTADAGHLVYLFQSEPEGALVPYRSYMRIWLTEMFLAKDRELATDRYPAVQASVRLAFGGSGDNLFATVSRPDPGKEGPGVRRNVKLTELLPFRGGTVALQVSLLDVAGASDIKLALEIIGDFSSLLTPPLAAVASLTSRVAASVERLDAALESAKKRPVLVLQDTLSAAPGGKLSPGHLAVV